MSKVIEQRVFNVIRQCLSISSTSAWCQHINRTASKCHKHNTSACQLTNTTHSNIHNTHSHLTASTLLQG